VEPNELRITTTQAIGTKLGKLSQTAMGMLIAGLVLLVIGFFMSPLTAAPANDPTAHSTILQAWLHGYLFWIGITVGSLGLLMLHHTVGGGWGFVIRRFLQAACAPQTLFVMLLLFIPVALGATDILPTHLYEWASEHAKADPVLQQKAGYLNAARFIGFAVLYFLIWIGFSSKLQSMGEIQYERTDPEIASKLNVWGAAGILVTILVVTFASVDWVMSIAPHWFSSIFGLLATASWALSTLAFMIILLALLGAETSIVRRLPTTYFRDLGNLTLALVMMWAYLAFSQYLITYSGNTVEEVSWYTDRNRGGWGIIPPLLIGVHFAAPFLILLVGDKIKRSPVRLAQVMLILIAARLLDCFWLVAPTFRPTFSISLADIGAPLFIGGIWLLTWISQVKDKPAVALFDPRMQAALHELDANGHGHGHGQEVAAHG
jgi:hypothetical protein